MRILSGLRPPEGPPEAWVRRRGGSVHRAGRLGAPGGVQPPGYLGGPLGGWLRLAVPFREELRPPPGGGGGGRGPTRAARYDASAPTARAAARSGSRRSPRRSAAG